MLTRSVRCGERLPSTVPGVRPVRTPNWSTAGRNVQPKAQELPEQEADQADDGARGHGQVEGLRRAGPDEPDDRPHPDDARHQERLPPGEGGQRAERADGEGPDRDVRSGPLPEEDEPEGERQRGHRGVEHGPVDQEHGRGHHQARRPGRGGGRQALFPGQAGEEDDRHQGADPGRRPGRRPRAAAHAPPPAPSPGRSGADGWRTRRWGRRRRGGTRPGRSPASSGSRTPRRRRCGRRGIAEGGEDGVPPAHHERGHGQEDEQCRNRGPMPVACAAVRRFPNLRSLLDLDLPCAFAPPDEDGATTAVRGRSGSRSSPEPAENERVTRNACSRASDKERRP